MKKLELEQLRKDINARIDAIINKPEEFVKGRWYKHKLYNIYAKYSCGYNNICFNKGSINNYIAMTDISLWRPVTDFTELTELLKAEVIKRIGKGKPIGVRDVDDVELWNGRYSGGNDKFHCDKMSDNWYYNQETDTLYNYGSGLAIVYENGVFATVANEENLNHNKEHVTNELIKRGFIKGCSFENTTGVYKKHNSSGELSFIMFNEKEGWKVLIDGWYVYHNGKYATIINPMQAKLEEAKLKYVNGTEFKSVESGYKYKVENGIKIGGQGRENELYCINSNGIGMGVIYNGDTDTWAEIIPQDKGAVLIEHAKKMGFNKMGIKFKSAFGGSVCEIKTINNWAYDKDTDSLWADHLNGCVYSDGQWATIIQEPIIIDGKEVVIKGIYASINGCWLDKLIIKSLQSLNPIFTEILKRMEEKNG